MAFGPQGGNLSGIDIAGRSAESRSTGPRRGDPGPDTVPNQLPLEFCDAREDSEYEPPVRRRGVDAFVQRDELNPERIELAQCVDELTKTPRESVVAVHHDCIETSPTARGEQLIQLWTPF